MSSVTEELKKLQAEEPLLMENKHRWVMFPLQYPEIWEMYKKHEASFWTAEEIDLAPDMRDWEVLRARRLLSAYFFYECPCDSSFFIFDHKASSNII